VQEKGEPASAMKAKDHSGLLLRLNNVNMLSSWIVSVAVLFATALAQINLRDVTVQLPNCTVRP